MSGDVAYFAKKLTAYFGGLEQTLEWYTMENGDILGHCFFPDVLNRPLEKLLKNNTDTGRIKKYVAFIEDMYANGDDAVKNIVEVSLLEYHALGDENNLNKLYPYLSVELWRLTKHIKEFWGGKKHAKRNR